MSPSPAAIQQLAKRHEPLLIMLIGPPGSGKTTWRQNYIRQCRAPVPDVVSTDDVIERESARTGRPYSDILDETDMPALTNMAMAAYVRMLSHGCDIIVDRTNLIERIRKRWLDLCPAHYVRVAIVFDPDPYVLADRLTSREQSGGKIIPVEVVTSMLMSYEPPRAGEFHHVLQAET